MFSRISRITYLQHWPNWEKKIIWKEVPLWLLFQVAPVGILIDPINFSFKYLLPSAKQKKRVCKTHRHRQFHLSFQECNQPSRAPPCLIGSPKTKICPFGLSPEWTKKKKERSVCVLLISHTPAGRSELSTPWKWGVSARLKNSQRFIRHWHNKLQNRPGPETGRLAAFYDPEGPWSSTGLLLTICWKRLHREWLMSAEFASRWWFFFGSRVRIWSWIGTEKAKK